MNGFQVTLRQTMGLTSTRSKFTRSYTDRRTQRWVALNVEDLTWYAAACLTGLSALRFKSNATAP